MAKIPHRPEPVVPIDYNAVVKRGLQPMGELAKSRTEESALFKNAIRLADERNQLRATNANVQGGDKLVTERLLQINKGSGLQAEHAVSQKVSMTHAEMGKLSKEQADTNTSLTASNALPAELPENSLESGLNEAELNAKKRSNATDKDTQQVSDIQSTLTNNQHNVEQPSFGSGMFMSEMPKRASQDMGRFESIQSACKFLETMHGDTSNKAWRFSLPGDELVKGVHMEQAKDGGWSITVASDEEHTDTLNEHLDTLLGALEDSGMQVSNVSFA